MSRIGKKPIVIPEGVNVKVEDNDVIVSGPKGVLKQTLNPDLLVEIKKNQVLVLNKAKEKKSAQALWGLTRTLIANMVRGVTTGFSKTLKIVGTGYRVKLDSSGEKEKLIFSLGFSHPVEVEAPDGIHFEIEGNDTVKVLGNDKILVGQIAAKIRAISPPEPYKGKGIRYQNEQPRHKPGKAGKAGAIGGEAK